MRWHYAVHKGKWFFEPACATTAAELFTGTPIEHGITIIRGEVDCPNCKRMMGMV